MPRRPSRATPQLVLLATFTAFFVFWLHDPPHELHAVIHVVPTWIAIAIMLASTKYFPLTNASCGLLGIAQATLLWPQIVDTCVWSVANEPMHRVRASFPAIESFLRVAPRLQLPVRIVIVLQSTIQIVAACVVWLFI